MIIAGVMSGSSLDGLDIAVVQFYGKEWSIIDTIGVEYSHEWEERLRGFHNLSALEYISFKYEYAHYIGQKLKATLIKPGYKIDYISFHGHTLVHDPKAGYTEQIGNGGIIAGITGVSTLTDFRSQDVALGGVGTPLAPYFDVNYLEGYDYYLNLGGIANITSVSVDSISAYDICPCNQVLNYFSKKLGYPFDDRGVMASNGNFDKELYSYFSSHDFFQKQAPKSLDNNWIREIFIEGIPQASSNDILHTYSLWMANCIAEQVINDSESTLYCTGGGSHNTFFINHLERLLKTKNCKLIIPSKKIIDFKEALLMASLAKNYLEGKTNIISKVTGASKDSIGGALYKV